MIGRLLRPADFERVLRTRSQASSAHFAVHHLADRPSLTAALSRVAEADRGKLLTGDAPISISPVEDSLPKALAGVWLGAVVPKRHARRAVTRTLLKRQIRVAVTARAESLSGGLWVVRLRAPFDRAAFPSAASDALKRSARAELDLVLGAAAQRLSLR